MNDNVKKLLGVIRFNKVRELENVFEDLLKYVSELEKDRDRVYQQLEDWNKDAEIVALKEELKSLRRKSNFVISDEEEERISAWIAQHNKEKHKDVHRCSAIGGVYTYSFIPTSIGVVGTVKCSCGDEFDFREL